MIAYRNFSLEPQPPEWLLQVMKRVSWETTAEYMNNRFEFVDVKRGENDSTRQRPVL